MVIKMEEGKQMLASMTREESSSFNKHSRFCCWLCIQSVLGTQMKQPVTVLVNQKEETEQNPVLSLLYAYHSKCLHGLAISVSPGRVLEMHSLWLQNQNLHFIRDTKVLEALLYIVRGCG